MVPSSATPALTTSEYGYAVSTIFAPDCSSTETHALSIGPLKDTMWYSPSTISFELEDPIHDL
jgi:hypothetical protein